MAAEKIYTESLIKNSKDAENIISGYRKERNGLAELRTPLNGVYKWTGLRSMGIAGVDVSQKEGELKQKFKAAKEFLINHEEWNVLAKAISVLQKDYFSEPEELEDGLLTISEQLMGCGYYITKQLKKIKGKLEKYDDQEIGKKIIDAGIKLQKNNCQNDDIAGRAALIFGLVIKIRVSKNVLCQEWMLNHLQEDLDILSKLLSPKSCEQKKNTREGSVDEAGSSRNDANVNVTASLVLEEELAALRAENNKEIEEQKRSPDFKGTPLFVAINTEIRRRQTRSENEENSSVVAGVLEGASVKQVCSSGHSQVL